MKERRRTEHTRDDGERSYASPQPAKPLSEAYLERDSGDKSGEEAVRELL